MAMKEKFEQHTADIRVEVAKLAELGDREGLYVWEKFTAEGGDSLGYVTADTEDAYPDGGMQDGYWYEKFNMIEYTSGTTDLSDGISELATNTFYFVTG